MRRKRSVNPLLKKLKGFQKAFRGRFLWLTRRQLSQEELLLYELAVAITDWDPRHETYGSFDATNQDLAEILGWKSDTTALKHKNSLIEKGIFKLRKDDRLEAKGFEKWQLRKPKPSDKEETAVNNKIKASNIEDQALERQEIQSQNAVYSLVSSKVGLGSLGDVEDVSDEELQGISDLFDERERGRG